MRSLRREVGGPPWRRRASQLSWLTIAALLALGMTLGVYAWGARLQRDGHSVPRMTER